MNAADRKQRIETIKHAIVRLKAHRKQALAKRHAATAHRLSLRIEKLERELRALESGSTRPKRDARVQQTPPKRGRSPDRPGAPSKPPGVHDPYSSVVVTPQNAARLKRFYERKLKQWFLTPKEKAWWSMRLNACLRALKARAPHRKDVRALRGRAAELRRKAVAARSVKRYAQSQSYVQQAERLEQSAAAEVDWQPTGEGHLSPRRGDGAMRSERAVQAEGGEEAASEGDDEKVSKDAEDMGEEKPLWKRWWVWGLGALAVGGAVALSRGGKMKGLLKLKIGKGAAAPSGSSFKVRRRLSATAA